MAFEDSAQRDLFNYLVYLTLVFLFFLIVNRRAGIHNNTTIQQMTGSCVKWREMAVSGGKW